jgi:hypothetical protein
MLFSKSTPVQIYHSSTKHFDDENMPYPSRQGALLGCQ